MWVLKDTLATTSRNHAIHHGQSLHQLVRRNHYCTVACQQRPAGAGMVFECVFGDGGGGGVATVSGSSSKGGSRLDWWSATSPTHLLIAAFLPTSPLQTCADGVQQDAVNHHALLLHTDAPAPPLQKAMPRGERETGRTKSSYPAIPSPANVDLKTERTGRPDTCGSRIQKGGRGYRAGSAATIPVLGATPSAVRHTCNAHAARKAANGHS